MLDVGRWNVRELADVWRAARPFPHVVIDDLVAAADLTTLSQAIAAEPHWPNRGEIYDMMASGESVQHPTLAAFHGELGAAGAIAVVAAITGRPVARVDMRSYVYMPGHYLLPHTDWQRAIGRLVAYAYYVWTQDCAGGELELFDVTTSDGVITETRPAGTIEPRANRIVLFDVTPASLHQVREVLGGARVSLAGWFYG
jgi:hypothetical protein